MASRPLPQRLVLRLRSPWTPPATFTWPTWTISAFAAWFRAVPWPHSPYIADTQENRVRKVTLSGTITTVAGTGQTGRAGDNGPATSAALNTPSGVAVDSSGNLYIADAGNHVIRRVDASAI